MEEDYDDPALEEEIELELSKISYSSDVDDPDTDVSLEESPDSEPISDELPESVLHYLNFVRSRSQNAERVILQDLESEEMSSDIYTVIPTNASECLAEMAAEYNEDPEELKKRILSQIDDEEQQIKETSENTIEPNDNKDVPSNEVADGCFFPDDDETVVSFTFRDVEERCKQEYEDWVEKQKVLEDEQTKQLKAKREMKEAKNEEEEARRQQRLEELEAERMKLEVFHAQQQAMMEEELLKEEEAWKEQLRQHKELINNLHIQIEEEKRAFEEQQAMERQVWAELQNMAAVKIQSAFRAFIVYKKYAPVLKERRAELKRKRELREAVEKELKEKQERWDRRVLEKKEQEERERKRREEKEREEHIEKMKRLELYEKKKEIMKLQREQLLLEQLERKEKDNLEIVSKNMDTEFKKEEETKNSQQEESVTETGEMELDYNNKDVEIMKEEKIEGKEEEETKIQRGIASQNTDNALGKENSEEEINGIEQEKDKKEELIFERKQEISSEEEKEDEKHGIMHEKLQYADVRSEEETLKPRRKEDFETNNEKLLENDIKDHCSTTVEFQKNSEASILSFAVINQESSIHSNFVDVRLDSGDNGQIDRSYASENLKKQQVAKEIHGKVTDQWTKAENSGDYFEQPLTLSDSVEEKRLAWMKTCKSWSRIYREHQNKKLVERSKPWKCSAGLLPPLSAALIIQAGPWNALQQVTTVTFQDLPGCSLSTLSQCLKLQFLSLRRCGLLALEGLGNCKDLKYIDVEENNIQVINCENLENLCILILNKNNISSLHGLHGCSNLLNLELSYNKITRIGGLESLKNLQRLVVNHNQLISTKGLSETPTLVYIDCSFNHLTHVEGIENCGVLQILKLQGNNLSELPSLENHVLLRELDLEDNSISSLEKISLYWLPLLRTLCLSQNSLTEVAPLFSCVSLEKLDISNNCLLDLKSIVCCLNGCDSLRELIILGNPLLQEENWRCSLRKLLPHLKILNGENLSSDAEIPDERTIQRPEPGSFATFCQSQIQKIELVSKKATARSVDGFSADAAQLQCWYFEKLMKLSSEHRYAHEYGILHTTKREETEEQTGHLNREAIDIIEKNNVITGVKENKQVSLDTPERWITSEHTPAAAINSFKTLPEIRKSKKNQQKKKSVQYFPNHSEKSEDRSALISPNRNKFSKQITARNGGSHLQHSGSSQNLAAIAIQSYWRGYRVRKEISFCTRLHFSATIIQSLWRSYCVRKKILADNQEHLYLMDKHKAATILQALWRGFHLRKKLANALAAVKRDETEDEYKEVNMDEFIFDEAVIEKEWPALESTHFLSQTPLSSDQLPLPKYNETARCEDKSHHLTWPSHKNWQVRERPKSFLSENSQISNRSEQRTLPSQKTSLRAEKEEKISEEWGFKEVSTAQLMLRRAHKMKAKKYNSKKIDPAVRLALFKNNENKHPPVKPPKKAQTAKTGYFEDKEEFSHTDMSSEKMDKNRERTSQWLHTQVWDFEGASPKNETCKHFLPEIDPEILKGGRVQLVTSPVRREDTDLELVSVTSTTTFTQNREKNNQPHRHSTGSSKKEVPAPERSLLGPSHKERISFRDHQVQFSGGWGSGKKKAKPLK
ncbi:leucine-rich repeat and IQ domain-containing protein 1 isoform X1 [Anolis carolinensis]|uniref:leucine-rich repeat and IQ domain-containing protein 1 isoform X1 n=2 Tax=Anolis carolinensis TaxID=28377 RepID=UPI002F2B2C4B